MNGLFIVVYVAFEKIKNFERLIQKNELIFKLRENLGVVFKYFMCQKPKVVVKRGQFKF